MELCYASIRIAFSSGRCEVIFGERIVDAGDPI
jgi:hypothetical protein